MKTLFKVSFCLSLGFQLPAKTTATFTSTSYTIMPSDTIIVFTQCIFKDGVKPNGTIACRIEALWFAQPWNAFNVWQVESAMLTLQMMNLICAFSLEVFYAASSTLQEIININSFLNEVSAWVFGKLLFSNYHSALFIAFREQCNMAWIKRIRRRLFVLQCRERAQIYLTKMTRKALCAFAKHAGCSFACKARIEYFQRLRNSR